MNPGGHKGVIPRSVRPRISDVPFSDSAKGKFNPGIYTIKGTGSGLSGEIVFEKEVTVNNPTQTLGASIQAEEKLADTIDDGDLSIQWSVQRKLANGKTWAEESYGPSKNHAYVTGVPVNPTNGQLETVLAIGCRGAKGKRPGNEGEEQGAAQASNAGVVNDIFEKEFTTLKMRRASDNELLTYWGAGDETSAVANTATLLDTAAGRCGAWADFFVEVLKAQGIAGANSVKVNANIPVVANMLGNLQPPFELAVGDQVAIYGRFKGEGQGNAQPKNEFVDNFIEVIAVDGNGVPTFTPAQSLGVHVVVKIEGIPGLAKTVFDPSYGFKREGATMRAAELALQRYRRQGGMQHFKRSMRMPSFRNRLRRALACDRRAAALRR